MGLKDIQLFRAGIFKQIKFLFSSPNQAQGALYYPEPGSVTKEVLPMHTAFVKPLTDKKAWEVEHDRKFAVWRDGVPFNDETVLLLSDRSYKPLAPHGRVKAEDNGSKEASLNDIAKMRHAQTRADFAKGYDQQIDVAHLVIICSWTVAGLAVLAFLLRSCGGG